MRSHRSRSPKVALLLSETYLAMVRNSVGAKLFRNLYATINGKRRDLTENGKLSCAVFVSSVLRHFGLVAEPHATVAGTVKDMKASGWGRIRTPRAGCVLVWEEVPCDRAKHAHIGFYVGKRTAVSNSARRRAPALHHWTYGSRDGEPVRRIEAMYWHRKLKTKT